MKLRIGPFAENVSEATAACIFMMVQGNVLALTASHWVIASQTGVVAVTIATLALTAIGNARRWVIALTLGVVTAVVDVFIHTGPLADGLIEAGLTGLGAMLMSLAIGTLIDKYRARAHRTNN